MTSVSLCDEPEIACSLFQCADHGKAPLRTLQRLRLYHSALIDEELKVYLLLLKVLHDLWCTVSGNLLGVGRGDVDIHIGLITFLNELFQGLEDAEEGTLGIHGTAAPDPAFGNVPGEWLMLPITCCRDHILVAHEEDGVTLRGL